MKKAESIPPSVNLPDEQSSGERSFFRLAVVGTAIAFGAAAAWVQSLHWSPIGLQIRISGGTLVAFLIGAVAGLFFWRIASSGRRAARYASIVLGLAAIGLYLHPLGFISAAQRPQIALGLAAAFLVLSTGAYLLWRVKRFLDADTAQAEAGEASRSALKNSQSPQTKV